MDGRQNISLKKLKKETLQQLDEARNATDHTSMEKYPSLSEGLDDVAVPLFGSRAAMIDHIRSIALSHVDTPVRILYFGCGDNRFLRELRREVKDIPLETIGVSVGDARSETQKAEDSALNIQFIDKKKPLFKPEGTFDLIVSNTTLLHLRDPLQSIKILYNSLREGGELRTDHTRPFLAGNFRGSSTTERAYKQADALLAHWESTGVGIEHLPHGLVLKKGPPRLSMAGVHYSNGYKQSTNEGQYIFDLDDSHT